METTEIADIGSMSVQLLDDETGEVLTTAPCYRCANRMLGSTQFPQASVTYRAVGSDVNGRPFSALLSKAATFDSGNFQVLIGEGPMEVEYRQTISFNITIHNQNLNFPTKYTFTAEPVAGFRQVFRPTSLIVPPKGRGSVNMIILQITAEPGTSYTFTATVTDGCVIHSVPKTVLIQMPVKAPCIHIQSAFQ